MAPSLAVAAEDQRAVTASPAPPAGNAVANINITPRRIVFEGARRTEAVYLFNQGTVPTTVDVALVDNIMLPSGEIVPLAIARERGAAVAEVVNRLHSARDMILAAPSRVTIAPGAGKTVRLLVRPPAAGAEQATEYRTHLTVTTVPSAASGYTLDQAVQGREEFSFRIQTVFGISVPVIVRTGGASATARLDGVTVTTRSADPAADQAASPAALDFTIGRSGSGSVYGNIEVRSGKGRSGELIGQIRGIAVYPELASRNAHVPLVRQPRHGETLTITYFADDGSLGSELASTAYLVP